jgi:redox-sensitive bicupin YhaK (pirin superfamily)
MALVQTLTGHEKDLGGGFTVRRLLPAARQRSVGPFIFFDHFGPVTEVPEANHDVRPHPHIGLATVTYLFEGAMMHRDSIGSEQVIEPGAINWMSAGRGIAHSERRPSALKSSRYVNHGLQLWTALPVEHEESDPTFAHTPAADIPEISAQGAPVRVLVGEAFGAKSPVATLSPTLYIDVQLQPGQSFELPPLAREMALYPVQGQVLIDGTVAAANTMAVLSPEGNRVQAVNGAARFAVVGGEPLDAPRHMWWNFVSSRKERIVEAANQWEAGGFAPVAGEQEFIPLPEKRFSA